MLLLQLGLLMVLLPVCCFAPGFFFVRKLRWNPLEKLCASVGLSLILLYLVCWGIYCVGGRGKGLPIQPAPYYALSVICFALAALSGPDLLRFLRIPVVRRALAGFGVLVVWVGCLTAAIRNFSGGTWFGDWLEHFQRTLFFIHHFPTNTWIFPGYQLPARPPMMNVLAGFFLAQTADRFELFQAIFVFLNILLFLPCYLMMPAFGKRARRRTWLLVLLFAASPLVMQNVTYTWTKSLAAFYVVLAIWLYLAGWRKRDMPRMVAAFVSLAAGLVAHYSAGPYIAILTLFYFIRIFPTRSDKWRELGWIVTACGLFAGTWLIWSLAIYGPKITLESNSSVTSSQAYKGSMAEKIVSNLFDSVVPVIVREPKLLSGISAQRTAGAVRDWTFVFYQTNAIFGMGLVGGPLVLWLAYRGLRRKREALPERAPERGKKKAFKAVKPRVVKSAAPAVDERSFWIVLIAAGLFLGIAVVGERDPLGVAHLTLLALQTLGLTMLAALIPWNNRRLAMLVLMGCTVDFSLGVWLQARVESLDNSPQSVVFPGVEFNGTDVETATQGPDALGFSAWNNWMYKNRMAAYNSWFRELNQRHGRDPKFQALLPNFQETLKKIQEDDASIWQGWFARNGGRVEFLGDHVAGDSGVGSEIALGLLALFFAGLAVQAYRT